MCENNRFLLIKAWGCGFWSDISHTAGQLLIAELTNRIPVIFWGPDSMYASENPIIKDAFTMYYLPVSNYSIDNVLNITNTFYPEGWNHSNLRLRRDPDFGYFQDISNILNRNEDVLVSNVHVYVDFLVPWIGEDHHVYSWKVEDIYRYLYQKYLKLQPYLSNEIEEFYLNNMKNGSPVLGVHIRGSDKIYECPNLHELNNQYPQEIDHYLNNNPTASIFLMTDSQSILAKYQQLYGNKLIYTNSIRTTNETFSVHHGLTHYNTTQKGIDIMKDTYLAMKCDCFIGNHTSNVSVAVSRLKEWPEGTIKLL